MNFDCNYVLFAVNKPDKAIENRSNRQLLQTKITYLLLLEGCINANKKITCIGICFNR